MAQVPAVINIATLLEPIPGENPSGANLRSVLIDNKFVQDKKTDIGYWHDRLLKTIHEEDPLTWDLSKGALPLPNWSLGIDIAQTALATKTKDLQIAALLTFSLVRYERNDQLAGLRDGLQLMHGLIEKFWETLYPEIDREDPYEPLQSRANVIEAIESRLALASKKIPLLNNRLRLNYSWNQWQEAEKNKGVEGTEEAGSGDPSQPKEKKVTFEDWKNAVTATTIEAVQERLDLIGECQTTLQSLNDIASEKFGREAPAVKNLEKALEDLHELLFKIVREKAPAVTDVPQDETLETTGNGNSELALSPVGIAISGPIRTREQALSQLKAVARFFEQTEKHSLIPYLLDRAVRWSDMKLIDVLQELIKDTSIVGQVKETLGIQDENSGA